MYNKKMLTNFWEELTTNEINWVNRYHKRVRNILTPSMNSNERDWLINQTAPLQQR